MSKPNIWSLTELGIQSMLGEGKCKKSERMSEMFLLDGTDSLCLYSSLNCQIRSGWFCNDDWTWISSEKRNKLSFCALFLCGSVMRAFWFLWAELSWVARCCLVFIKRAPVFSLLFHCTKVVEALEAPWSRFKVCWANVKWRGENATCDTVNHHLSNRTIW